MSGLRAVLDSKAEYWCDDCDKEKLGADMESPRTCKACKKWWNDNVWKKPKPAKPQEKVETINTKTNPIYYWHFDGGMVPKTTVESFRFNKVMLRIPML